MNSKAIKRQLLAAVAMVLVAAIALGSSTYAWFVASGTVTATGMKVQAQTDGGLAIRFDGGTWGTSATAGMDTGTRLYPASTIDLQNWYHATAEAADMFDGKPGTRSNITTSVFNGAQGAYGDNSYVLMREFEIRSTSGDPKTYGLYVSNITVSNPSKTMSTALRVGIQYDHTVTSEEGQSTTTPYYRLFGPVTVGENENANNATDNYPVYNAGDVAIGTVILATPNVKTDTDPKNSIIIPETIEIPYNASNNGIKVKIFVWFEGEDHNLNSDNFNAEELSVTVDFTSLKTGTTDTNASTASKVDLTGNVTVASSATQFGGTDYYLISGMTALDGSTPLYTKASGALTNASEIFAITTGGLVTPYNALVKLPD